MNVYHLLLFFPLAWALRSIPHRPIVTSLQSAKDPRQAISPCVIKCIGVGGGGGNAMMRMIQNGVRELSIQYHDIVSLTLC